MIKIKLSFEIAYLDYINYVIGNSKYYRLLPILAVVHVTNKSRLIFRLSLCKFNFIMNQEANN